MLAFSVQPASAFAGSYLRSVVTLEDAGGNVLPTDGQIVTIALGSGPAAASLGGTLSEATVRGSATFSDLTVPIARTGYSLRATSAGLSTASSAMFQIMPGAIASVWVNPGAALLNWSDGPKTVELFAFASDVFGNLVPASFKWASSNATTGFVDASGTVTGNGIGIATITASADRATGAAKIGSWCSTRCGPLVSVGFSQLPSSIRAGTRFVVSVPLSARSVKGVR
jgi:hypothetical protein